MSFTRRFFYCKLCKISTHDEISFHGHLYGLQHAKHLARSNGTKFKRREKEKDYFCEICQIKIGGNWFNYETHLNGRKHSRQLRYYKK